MPSKTLKQHGFMALCSTRSGRKRAKKPCPSIKVAKEFLKADRGKKFKKRKR